MTPSPAHDRETSSLAVTERRRSSSHHSKLGSKKADYTDVVTWVLEDLEKDSSFFGKNPTRSVPHFDISEVTVGKYLGEGEFGIVNEVTTFDISDNCACSGCKPDERNDGMSSSQKTLKVENFPPQIEFDSSLSESVLPQHKKVESTGGGSKVSFAESVTFNDIGDEWFVGEDADDEDYHPLSTADRGYMKDHCIRDGLARYAIKGLKSDIPKKMQEDAAIDIASEAKFLASLGHPSIVKLRGIVGKPGRPGFCIILDRLHSTLVKKMTDWKAAEKHYTGFMGMGTRKEDLLNCRHDRLVALYDVARALKYLHEHKILFRDIKPENIGFDVRGDAKLFDFGLAKEMLPRDLVTPPDSYEATGITGSRRYMAPEVVMCKNYGLSADVFGFGILFHEIMSLKTPFKNMNADKHFTQVVVKGKRPGGIKFLSRPIHAMMEECWATLPSDRPTFRRICEAIGAELGIIELQTGHHRRLSDRSNQLMDVSWTSRYGSHQAHRERSNSSASKAE